MTKAHVRTSSMETKILKADAPLSIRAGTLSRRRSRPEEPPQRRETVAINAEELLRALWNPQSPHISSGIVRLAGPGEAGFFAAGDMGISVGARCKKAALPKIH